MLAARRHASIAQNLRRTSVPQHHRLSRGPHRRTFLTESLQPLREGFLDLALALPWPSTLPPYSSTIILTTFVTRLVFTLPFSIWAKKRQWRLEEDVLPELMTYRKETAIQIANKMKLEGYGKRGIDVFRREHIERLNRALEIRKKELFAEHSCSPMTTMVVPALSQLPLFVISTALFSSVAMRPTPLDDEEFLSLTSLARPDPTGILPVSLGLVTLANVETGGWFVGTERAARTAAIEARQDELDAKKREEGVVVKPKPRNVIQGSLRLFSVMRIVIGAMIDGSVIVYWLSSATFGLFQSWGFNWWDARRTARLSRPLERPLPPLKPKKVRS